MKNLFLLLIITSVFSFTGKYAKAHCEVPCGIYDDSLRIELIKEHIGTIKKAMINIAELSEEGDKNYNQIVRWIITKEEHAVKIQEIVNQYFLTQRVKFPGSEDKEKYDHYVTQLALCHEMLVYAMKCKQTIDTEFTDKLLNSLEGFSHEYFENHHEH